jgi:molecular chaperone GrpE
MVDSPGSDASLIDPLSGDPINGQPITGEPTNNEEVLEMVSDEKIIADLTGDLQRLQAEYSNYRKRIERDRALAHEIAIASVLSDLLPILDDIERAAGHGELTGGFKAVADQLASTTSRLGLTRYGDVPCTFDPNIHEAMLHETSPDVSEETVTKILQPGYSYKERILRPARVTVTDPE